MAIEVLEKEGVWVRVAAAVGVVVAVVVARDKDIEHQTRSCEKDQLIRDQEDEVIVVVVVVERQHDGAAVFVQRDVVEVDFATRVA